MKKIYLLSAAFAALMAVSCNKAAEVAEPAGPAKPIEVNISINGEPVTRAVGTTYANESKVNSLQVFVFNGDDRESYKDAGAAMTALVPATAGERTVYAVVNAPDLSSVMKLSDLQATASLLKDNALDNFIMTGSYKDELVDGGNIPITVKRIASRVSIGKISTDFKDYRAGYSVDVKAIYLINVASDCVLEGEQAASAWENKLAYVQGDCDALLYDALENVSVNNETPYAVEHAFYPYPNIYPQEGSSDTYDAEWSPRGTILVLEVGLKDGDGEPVALSNGETTGYYPIVLPSIGRNKTYIIQEVVISRLPGEVPYKPIETGESQVTITVAGWETGLNIPVYNI